MRVWELLVVGRRREPARQMVATMLGVTVVTTGLLVGAQTVSGPWIGVGGFLLLAVMTVALLGGAYHAFTNAGVVASCLPVTGVVVGVGLARTVMHWVGWTTPNRGLRTEDVAVVLLAVAVVTTVGATVVGVVWRR
ncbi:MAG: hypothetical protein ABEJ57_04845 [Halobacteriaceae archaeon]